MDRLVRVLVADDHDIVRKGVSYIVRDLFPAAIIEEARNGEEALHKCLAEAWHLVILDITMPKMSGLEVLRQAKQQRPELCVIIFSTHMWSQHVRLALKLGAVGYVGKAEVVEELKPAILAALDGKTYLSSQLANGLEEQLPDDG